MELHELLSVLLYQDCTAFIPAEEARLKILAEANGGNIALAGYIGYFHKTQQTPSPEQLNNYITCGPRGASSNGHKGGNIDYELEWALHFKDAHPPGSFAIALANTWEEAEAEYVGEAYTNSPSDCLRRVSQPSRTYRP
jgi:hypothetical protein